MDDVEESKRLKNICGMCAVYISVLCMKCVVNNDWMLKRKSRLGSNLTEGGQRPSPEEGKIQGV